MVLGLVLVPIALGMACEAPDRPVDAVAPPSSSAEQEPSIAQPAAPEAVSGPRACASKRPRHLEAADTTETSSAIAIATFVDSSASNQRVVYVADEDARAIAILDHDTLEQIGVTELEGKPKHVRVLSDGRVAVTLGDVGRVVVLEPGTHASDALEVRCSAEVAAEPWSLAERPGELVVTSGFGGALTVLETGDLHVRRAIDLPREPRAVLLDDDGRRAFVTHAIGGIVSVVDLAGEDAPATISLRTGHILEANADPPTASRPRDAAQGYAMARTSLGAIGVATGSEARTPRTRLLVPHVSEDTGSAVIASSGGYGASFGTRPVAPIVGVVDPDARTLLTHGVVDAKPIGLTANCLLPRSAVAAGGALYVACADVDAVFAYDASLMDPAAAVLRRYPTVPTPTSLALDGDAVLVWSEVARTVQRVVLHPSANGAPASAQVVLWERDGEARSANLLRGRYLFHTSQDTRLARGRACASCHPDGRDDGLVWLSPDGRRQTPMLAGRLAGTAPYGWSGEHRTLEDHLTSTFFRLDGSGLVAAPDDLAALVGYIQSLSLPTTSTSPSADRIAQGHGVFEANGCGNCHRDGGTDGVAYDVGSGGPRGRGAFDTPSLARVGRTAPYFHDGRYASLTDLLSDANTRMFDPEKISASDRTALAAYLESL